MQYLFITHAARRHVAALTAFLRSESAGGLVLIVSALVALGWANSAAAPAYHALLHYPLGVGSLALIAVVLWLAGSLDTWLASTALDRGLRVLTVVAAAAAAYFATLWLTGMRPRHFRRS